MKKVILRLEEDPPAKCYNFYGYTLGMVLVRKECYSWFYNNFIQVGYFPENDVFRFDGNLGAFDLDIFYTENIDDAMFDKFNINILEYVKFALDMDKWVFISSIDEYYNPDRTQYKKEHFMHDLLIYGYDDENKTFTVIGYDKTRHYRKTHLEYVNFLAGKPKGICLHRIDESFVNRSRLDIQMIIQQIELYLNLAKQNRPGEKETEGTLYGQEAFLFLGNHMDATSWNDKIFTFTLLFCEHKKCMIMRMEYLQSFLSTDFQSIIESYREVVKLANRIHLCALKYSIKKDKAINARIQSYFVKALSVEKVCLLNLTEKLTLYREQTDGEY